MAKQRYVNTKFWNDTYISVLDPIEKLLFIYFLTNEHSNISGIYELPLKIIAVETGIDASMLDKILPRLNEKILYTKGYVVIKNFVKHQETPSEQVKKGIANSLKEIPKEFLEDLIRSGSYHIPKDCMDTLSIPPIDSPSYSNSNLNPNLNSNSNLKVSKSLPSEVDTEMASFLEECIRKTLPNFKKPNIEKWADEIRKLREIDKRTVEQIRYVIAWCQNDSFWKANILSTATLRKQWDKLEARIRSEASNKRKVMNFDV